MMDVSLWTRGFEKKNNAKVRLFCLPYAGGNAENFYPWREKMPDFLELCPLQLPGRSYRFAETPYEHLNSLVTVLGEVISQYDDLPFYLYGHSMGGLLSYELAHYLNKTFKLQTKHLFISARGAPSLPVLNKYHHLDDKEFLDNIFALNSDHDGLEFNEELMSLMLPTLRADFKICEEYRYRERPKLNCPLTIFASRNDNFAPYSTMKLWQKETKGHFQLIEIRGGHFFIRTHADEMLSFIFNDLQKYYI